MTTRRCALVIGAVLDPRDARHAQAGLDLGNLPLEDRDTPRREVGDVRGLVEPCYRDQLQRLEFALPRLLAGRIGCLAPGGLEFRLARGELRAQRRVVTPHAGQR